MSIKNIPITPSDQDYVDKLDDQIRLLKKQIKQAFPNIDGAITVPLAQINSLPSVLASLNSDLDQIIADIDTAISDTNTAAVTLAAKTHKGFNALAKLPKGIIFPFTDDPASVGAEYYVSDGRHGTPPLDTTFTPFRAFIMYRGS